LISPVAPLLLRGVFIGEEMALPGVKFGLWRLSGDKGDEKRARDDGDSIPRDGELMRGEKVCGESLRADFCGEPNRAPLYGSMRLNGDTNRGENALVNGEDRERDRGEDRCCPGCEVGGSKKDITAVLPST
jgi:hypothetical protein